MVKMVHDTADGVIENFFNLYTMRMQIAAISDQMVWPIIPEYGLRTPLGYLFGAHTGNSCENRCEISRIREIEQRYKNL